ncbi:flagellar basal body protein FliL [Rhodobacteraceae bacterium Araon29]
MVDTKTDSEVFQKPNYKPLLIISFILSLILGFGAFYLIQYLYPSHTESTHKSLVSDQAYDADDFAFVPLDPIIISFGKGADKSHLRLRAQLEVPSAQQHKVEQLKPRIVDVLNTFLSAIELSELEQPAALSLLRAKMLRRVKIVLGETTVNELLISEFVLN